MAKIKITENELKQIIRESVEGVLKEGLDEDRDAKFQKRYDAYNKAAQDYNNNFSKEWGNLTQGEQQKWQNEYNKLASSGQFSGITPESLYNSRRNSAQTTMNSALNRRGVGAAMKKQVDLANQKLKQAETEKTDLKTRLTQANNLNAGYKNAISQITQALRMPVYENTMFSTQQNTFQTGSTGITPEQLSNIKEKNANAAAQTAVPNLGEIINSIKSLRQQLAQAKRNAAAKPVAPTNAPVQQQGQQNRPAAAPMTPGQAPAIAASTNTAAGLARTNVPGNSRA